jgi:hypothetical protein
MDEQNQSPHITLRQPAHLPFPDHVYHLIALNRPLGRVKGPESLTGVDPSLDGAVILLDDVMPPPGLCRVLSPSCRLSLGEISFWRARLSA